MGIRYEKDERRAVNGPVIFFTGINADNAIINAINDAFISKLSFYAYRLPGETTATIGASEGFLYGIKEPGFVISQFNPEIDYITIPFKNLKSENLKIEDSYCFPKQSTSKEEYENEVREIISGAQRKEWEKIVAARVKVIEKETNPGEIFNNLCNYNSDAFIYCFSTPVTGCWIGASPELLLKAHKGEFYSMALAGTKSRDENSNDSESISKNWDKKNIHEQEVVTEYINKVFSSHGILVSTGELHELNAGKVKHLCTEIKGTLKESFNADRLSSLLHHLSPTPALCGLPKEKALEFISSHENFSRGCYGGFCGPFKDTEDFYFHVNLRCAGLIEEKIFLYAGGGITAMSDPIKEWEETELKLSTMEKGLIY